MIVDPGGPAGFAATNAVVGTTPEPSIVGGFPETWVNGSECGNEPAIQIWEYAQDTYILRQSQCTNFEGPFMYLLFGGDQALLLDTGAGSIQIGGAVSGLIAHYAQATGQSPIQLTVAHTHAHGDHIAGDGQFLGRPFTDVVTPNVGSVISFFGFSDWPNDSVTFSLGERVLDVLGIPGHEDSHIALYDRDTALLLTGDTLYPGFLFIGNAVSQGNFVKYQASIQRLVEFTADKPVNWVLGTHVEMTSTPSVAYRYGTNNQPTERMLHLDRDHLLELNDAVIAMGADPVQEVHDDFIIQPIN